MKNKNFFPFERNRYFYGKMLTARDLETEQRYLNDKRRTVNKAVFGAGIVHGLGTYINDESSVSVESGLAFDYTGREIVVDNSLVKKMMTIEGYETLAGSEQCYLCLSYNETDREPVSAIGIRDRESDEFNKIQESYRLYLDKSTPNFAAIYEDGGRNYVDIVYNSEDLIIVQIIPKIAVKNNEFTIGYIAVKNISKPALSLKISFESDYFGIDNSDSIELSYNESDSEREGIIKAFFPLSVKGSSDSQILWSKTPIKISVTMGDSSKAVEFSDARNINICKTVREAEQFYNMKISSLNEIYSGDETPIYLAKIDYGEAGTIHVLRKVFSHPFDQHITKYKYAPNFNTSSNDNFILEKTESSMKLLDYWQKPEVDVNYNPKSKSLSFSFGMPSLEAYDYATASGTLKIPLTGTIKVNSRFFSEDIPHNLGVGDVSITLSAEFDSDEIESEGERRLLFGNGEVFAAKSMFKAVPKAELAAVLSPEKGTFKVGIWCKDYIQGREITIKWFAYKPTRDTAATVKFIKPTLKIIPEMKKIKVREQLSFKADVQGTPDKSVVWEVKDMDGGVIDSKGVYRAPSIPGIYEITSRSGADSEVYSSAFVIVEE